MRKSTLSNRFKLLTYLLILCFISIGVYTYIALQNLNYYNAIENSIFGLESKIQTLRKNEKDFLSRENKNPLFFTTGKSQYVDNFEDNVSDALTICDDLMNSSLFKDTDTKQMVGSASLYLKQYHHTFGNIVHAMYEKGYKNFGLIGEMRNAIHEIEQKLKNKNDDHLMVYLLTSRRHEKDFLIRLDLNYKAKFRAHNKEFRMAVQRSNHSNLEKKEILQLLDNYEKTFLLVVNKYSQIGINENTGLIGSLASDINSVEPIIEKAKKKALLQLAKESSATMKMILFFIGCGAATMLILSTFILKGVKKSLGAEPYIVAQIAKEVAEGNLKLDPKIRKNPKGVLKSIVTMVDQLEKILTKILLVSEQLNKASKTLNQSSTKISNGVHNQASAFQEISATMQEMSANIKQNSDNAILSNKSTKEAISEIDGVKHHAQEATQAVKNISEKINIIREISLQTNILALNATIEAAKAGIHGKGFAVVAKEVKKLANISQMAADQITEMAETNIILSNKTNLKLQAIIPDIKRNAQFLEEVTLASIEQSQGSQKVFDAMQELNYVVQESSNASEMMVFSVSNLSEQANELIEMINHFKLSKS